MDSRNVCDLLREEAVLINITIAEKPMKTGFSFVGACYDMADAFASPKQQVLVQFIDGNVVYHKQHEKRMLTSRVHGTMVMVQPCHGPVFLVPGCGNFQGDRIAGKQIFENL